MSKKEGDSRSDMTLKESHGASILSELLSAPGIPNVMIKERLRKVYGVSDNRQETQVPNLEEACPKGERTNDVAERAKRPKLNSKPQPQEAEPAEGSQKVRRSVLDVDTLLTPITASLEVQQLLGLSAAETEVLVQHLEVPDEDPILALRLNPAWTDIYGHVAADAVLDYIGQWEMDPGSRRDSEDGHRFLYHFRLTSEIGRCRRATKIAFPRAFALSPDALAVAIAGGARIDPHMLPLARCVMITKLGALQDDVMTYEFFYV